MSNRGFLSFLLTRGDTVWGDWSQQREIDELAARTDQASAAQRAAEDSVAALRQTVTAQAAELARMQLALQVVSELLVERGVLDEAGLDARLEAATKAVEAAQPRPKQGVVCANCGMSYDAAKMVGTLCKRCHAL